MSEIVGIAVVRNEVNAAMAVSVDSTEVKTLKEYFDFDRITNSSKCKECKKVVKSGQYTTNLKQHFEKHHPDLYKACATATEEPPKKRKRADSVSSNSNGQQLGITEVSLICIWQNFFRTYTISVRLF